MYLAYNSYKNIRFAGFYLQNILLDNKSDEEKEKFFVQLGASVEIFFPNKKPEELSDSLILWTTPEGKITDAEYSYEEPENEQFVQMPVPEKDLKAFVEAFKDFTLEFDSD